MNEYKFKICVHCNAKFKHKFSLDDHTLRKHPEKHPDLIATISSKIHECTYCTYKTTRKSHWIQHLNKHAKTKLIYFRIKEEQNIVEARSNMEVLQTQNIKIKVEENWEDCKPFEPLYITEHANNNDLIDGNRKIALNSHMKEHESQNISEIHDFEVMCTHCNATFASKQKLDNHIISKHPNSMASISSKIHECKLCTYKTTVKSNLTQHMTKHTETADIYKHPETVDNYKFKICVHCNAKFKSKVSLDNHTVRKHPDHAASVSRKLLECEHCAFITVTKADLDRHMLKHSKSAGSYNLSVCLHCNAKYKSKQLLDYHILRKHPNAIASVSSKIHECTHCTYKTVRKANLDRHMSQHSKNAAIYNLKICVHCNAKFKNKISLDNHTIRKHPNLASVTRKVHECPCCTYKTILKANLHQHMFKHPEAANNHKFQICVHCNAKHRSKQSLDEHVIRKHPNFISSITSKLHQCTYCTYKSTLRTSFAKHMLKHPETVNNYKFQICVYCNAKHKSKRSLDEHVIRQHPNFISSITSKLHQCTYCTYKSTLRNSFAKHMLKHPEAVNNYKFQICVHCNAQLKGKRSLDEHVIRKHPDSVASITSKMYECTYCTYKSTQSTYFAKHMLKHPEAANNYKFQICVHCNLKHKSKRSLDEHVIRKHPDSVASITSKIHECTYCTYKSTLRNSFAKHTLKHPETANNSSITSKIHECTYCTYKSTVSTSLAKHMLKHPEAVNNCKFQICVHCNAKFKNKISLDNHTIRYHPNFVAAVTSKVHECPCCTYKTTLKGNLHKHMLIHPEAVNNYKFQICIHCNAKFKNKISLDNHTIRYHPNFVASVTRKVHECPCCTYKTTLKGNLHKHMLIHPEAVNVVHTKLHYNV
nr:unnamed protein product [Callosobruchus analis]